MNPLLSESSLVNSSLHKEFHDHDQKTRRRWRWRRRRWWWKRRIWWCEKCRRWRTLKTWSSARPLHRREERSRARRTRIDRFPCFRPCRPAIMMVMLGRRRISPTSSLIPGNTNVFIGPESDHWLCLSLTDWLTHWLTDSLLFSKLDWCDPGVWRCQLKTCWGCYCCWCW